MVLAQDWAQRVQVSQIREVEEQDLGAPDAKPVRPGAHHRSLLDRAQLARGPARRAAP